MIIEIGKKEKQFINAYFECVRFTEDNDTDFCEVWEREQIIECLAFFVYAECYLSDKASRRQDMIFGCRVMVMELDFGIGIQAITLTMCETGYSENLSSLANLTFYTMNLWHN